MGVPEKPSTDEDRPSTRASATANGAVVSGVMLEKSPQADTDGEGSAGMEATTSAAEIGAREEMPGWRFWMLGLGLNLGLVLSIMDTSIVATSLYTIAIEFQSFETVNWVALAYSLTYLGCSVFFTRISDVIGRRNAFVLGFAIFMIFSLACGFAQSLSQLIAFRALQGVGGSALFSLTMVIYMEASPDSKKKFIAPLIGSVLTVAGVMGPVLGGILTTYTSWRWVFWINGPIGAVSIATFLLAWPKPEHYPPVERRSWKELDYVGSILLIAASVLVVFPFQNAGTKADVWGEAIFLAPLIVGIFCWVALFAWEYVVETRWGDKMAPAFPLVLLRNRAYAATFLHTMLVGFPYYVVIFTVPVRLQIVNGQTALHAGLMLLPMVVSSAAGSAIGGALNGRKNQVAETLAGATVSMMLGVGLEMTLSASADLEPKLLGFLTFIGFGFGATASSSTIISGLLAPIREHAPGQGIIAQSRFLGGSLGIAASSAILAVHIRNQLGGVVTQEQLNTLGSPTSNVTEAQHQLIRETYADAFREDMIVCLAVLALGLLMTIGIYRRNRPTIVEMQAERVKVEAARRRALHTPPVVEV